MNPTKDVTPIYKVSYGEYSVFAVGECFIVLVWGDESLNRSPNPKPAQPFESSREQLAVSCVSDLLRAQLSYWLPQGPGIRV